MLHLVVTLTVRADAIDAFRAFERHAATVMARHGGRIERTIVLHGEPGAATFREVHLVTFRDESAFARYRADDALRAVAPLRERSVLHTEVLTGVAGPDYHRLEPPSPE